MNLENKKIGLIGVGNMGTSILEGLLSQGLVLPGQVSVYDKLEEKADAFTQRWQTNQETASQEIARQSNILIIAIKPQDFDSLTKELKGTLNSSHIVISILAGMSLKKMAEGLGREAGFVRAMPNLGARVGESLTALTSSAGDALKIAEEIFSGCGKTILLDEKHFDLITALSGSGPAYFFLLMEMIAAKALEKGLSKEVARAIAVQTACGASKLADASKEDTACLREQVTSKGGTTAAAFEVLESREIREIFSKAFDAALQRSRELRGN